MQHRFVSGPQSPEMHEKTSIDAPNARHRDAFRAAAMAFRDRDRPQIALRQRMATTSASMLMTPNESPQNECHQPTP